MDYVDRGFQNYTTTKYIQKAIDQCGCKAHLFRRQGQVTRCDLSLLAISFTTDLTMIITIIVCFRVYFAVHSMNACYDFSSNNVDFFWTFCTRVWLLSVWKMPVFFFFCFILCPFLYLHPSFVSLLLLNSKSCDIHVFPLPQLLLHKRHNKDYLIVFYFITKNNIVWGKCPWN